MWVLVKDPELEVVAVAIHLYMELCLAVDSMPMEPYPRLSVIFLPNHDVHQRLSIQSAHRKH